MFKSAATKIAHNSTVPALGGNKEIRTLQDLITAEKAVLQSSQKLAVDLAKASEALKMWGVGEGDDLGDTLTACTTLLLHFASALSRFSSHEGTIRETMKAVRTREENLDEIKRRRKSLASKADAADKKLSKMSPDNKNYPPQMEALDKLRDLIRSMDTDIMNEEADLEYFKRVSAKNWMGLKFGGLQECGQKGTIVGELGKLVIAEIPLDATEPGLPRPYYTGHARVDYLVSEAQRAVQEVVFSAEPNRNPSLITLPGSELPPVPSGSQDSRPVSQYTGDMSYPYSNSPLMSNRYSQGSGSLSAQGFAGLPQVPPQTPGQDFGLGSYLLADHSTPPPPSHHAYSSQLQPQTYQPQGDAYSPTHTSRNVNEFGTYPAPGPFGPRSSSLRQPGGGNEKDAAAISPSSGGPSAGRFATFPVKGGPRPLPGAEAGVSSATPVPPLSIHDRPPSLDVDRSNGSFSTSIAEALGQEWVPPMPQEPTSASASKAARKHAEAAAESMESYSPPPPMYTPTGGIVDDHPANGEYKNGSTGARVGAGPTGPADSEVDNHADEGDMQLAYADDAAEDEASLSVPDRGDRRVRFGSVRDVNEEMAKRNLERPTSQHIREQAQGSNTNETRSSNDQSRSLRGSSPLAQSPVEDTTTRIPSPPPVQAQVPEDSVRLADKSDHYDENALNAAAAREVSRELDALMFSSPIQAPVRAPSPLQPPQPPFARNAVSPQPINVEVASESGDGTPRSPTASLRNEMQYVRERHKSPSAPTSPSAEPDRNSVIQPPSPTGPILTKDHQRSLPSPSPAISIPPVSPSPSGKSNGTPYRTPSEYPAGAPATPGSFYSLPQAVTGSGSSFPSTAGTRTISAAAFKRQIRTNNSALSLPMSGESGAGDAVVSPLVLKKRPLPSSPYPSQRLQPPVEAPGTQRVPSAPMPGQRLNPAADAGAYDDPRARSVSARSPDDSTYARRSYAQTPGQGAEHLGEDEDEFDYISAYVNSGNPPARGEAASPAGRQHSRYADEGELR